MELTPLDIFKKAERELMADYLRALDLFDAIPRNAGGDRPLYAYHQRALAARLACVARDERRAEEERLGLEPTP